jgi:hypothetical protein
MKKSELIEYLKKYPDDIEIVIFKQGGMDDCGVRIEYYDKLKEKDIIESNCISFLTYGFKILDETIFKEIGRYMFDNNNPKVLIIGRSF